MTRNNAARFIQKRYMLSKVPLILPRGTVNAITNRALGKIVVEAWNAPGTNKYYLTPNTLKFRLNNKGRYNSPYTKNPGQYRYRRATFVGNAPKQNNMKNVMARAKKISNKISNQKAERRNLIPNNRIGTTNWNALAWSPPSATRRSPVSRYVPSPNWNISPIGRNENNNANRHDLAVLSRLRQAAATAGRTRRRLNF